MILVTGRDTGFLAYIDEHEIVQIKKMREERSSYPFFSRIFLKNDKERYEYFLDVVEDETEIKRRIKHEKLDLGREARSYFEGGTP